jgi:hypothetical protein
LFSSAPERHLAGIMGFRAVAFQSRLAAIRAIRQDDLPTLTLIFRKILRSAR